MPIQDYYNIVHKKMAVYYVYESANMKYVIKMQIQVNFNYYSETGLFWSHIFFPDTWLRLRLFLFRLQ